MQVPDDFKFENIAFHSDPNHLLFNHDSKKLQILRWIESQEQYMENLPLNQRLLVLLTTDNNINEPIREGVVGRDRNGIPYNHMDTIIVQLETHLKQIEYVNRLNQSILNLRQGEREIQDCVRMLNEIRVRASQGGEWGPEGTFQHYIMAPLYKIISEAPELPVDINLFRVTDGQWAEHIHDSPKELKSFTLSLKGYIDSNHIFKTDVLSQAYYCRDDYIRNIMSVEFKRGTRVLYIGKYSIGSVNEILATGHIYEYKEKHYQKNIRHWPIISKIDLEQGRLRLDIRRTLTGENLIQLQDNKIWHQRVQQTHGEQLFDMSFHNGFLSNNMVNIKCNIIHSSALPRNTQRPPSFIHRYLKRIDNIRKNWEPNLLKYGLFDGTEKLYFNDILKRIRKVEEKMDMVTRDGNPTYVNVMAFCEILFEEISKQPYMCKEEAMRPPAYPTNEQLQKINQMKAMGKIGTDPNTEQIFCNSIFLDGSAEQTRATRWPQEIHQHNADGIERPNHNGLNHFRSVVIGIYMLSLLSKMDYFKNIVAELNKSELELIMISPYFKSLFRKDELGSWPRVPLLKNGVFKNIFPKLSEDPDFRLFEKCTKDNMVSFSSSMFFMEFAKKSWPDCDSAIIELIGLSYISHIDHMEGKSKGESVRYIKSWFSRNSRNNKLVRLYKIILPIAAGSHYIDHCRAGTYLSEWVGGDVTYGALETEPLPTLGHFIEMNCGTAEYEGYYHKMTRLIMKLLILTEYDTIGGVAVGNTDEDMRQIHQSIEVNDRYKNKSNIICRTDLEPQNRFKGNFNRYSNNFGILRDHINTLFNIQILITDIVTMSDMEVEVGGGQTSKKKTKRKSKRKSKRKKTIKRKKKTKRKGK